MILCEYCEILKNSFFIEHLWCLLVELLAHSHAIYKLTMYKLTMPKVTKIVFSINIVSDVAFNVQNKWFKNLILTYFSPMSYFYTPWKLQKTYGFLTFSGGIEMWLKWVKGLPGAVLDIGLGLRSLLVLKLLHIRYLFSNSFWYQNRFTNIWETMEIVVDKKFVK